MYFGSGDHTFFGWCHSADSGVALDCVAVICGPVGYEYTRAHRSLRHLADRLARRGIPAIRFDYHGIGDSPGGDLDPARLDAWQANIADAIRRARELTGRSRVCLVGVRLGASLAAMAAAREDIDLLVLWNACVTGRPYLRELQAIAASAEDTASSVEGALESGGFVMTAETRESISKINLAAIDFRARRVLVVARDDMAPEKKLPESLAARGVAFDQERLPGWSGMMAEHQFTVVPDAALDRIVDWVALHGASASPFGEGRGEGGATVSLPILGECREEGRQLIEERLCRFGDGNRLFGILSRPAVPTDRPAIVLFNAGAVHHVGPNRIYVNIARALAALGHPVLRFDLDTLGDSVLDDAWRENYPYPRTAMRDVRDAFEFVQGLDNRKVIAMGLCSGAHMAFHAGLDESHAALDEIVMINPLVFYWVEGMSLDTTTKFEDMQAYRKSMRDPSRWKKLLRGEVNLKRLVQVVATYPATLAKPYWDAMKETLLPNSGTRLSRDLRRLMALGRKVTFFIADRDPGRQILMVEARRTMMRGMKSGAIKVRMIPGGDHTFSRLGPREDLVKALVEHLK